MKILLAEDELGLSNPYARALRMNGYEVDQAFDGEEALDYLNRAKYDLMIFDIMMPKKTGLEVLKEIRKAGNTGYVIMLTAMGEIDDKVAGLDMGADEYLSKPISLKELLARLRSVERRMDTNVGENIITKGSVKLNIAEQELSATNSIILAGKETKLMEILMLNKKISTDYIYNQIWSKDEDGDKGYVWIYISYLRQKLKAINANLEIIGEENSDFELVEV